MSSRIVAIVGAALLFALALPPWSVSALSWVALVPLLWVLYGLRPGAAAIAGLLWGTVAIWGVGYWVPLGLATYYEQPVWFGVAFSLVASVVFAGSYAAGFGACAAWVSVRTAGASRACLIACLWVVWELARARLLTGDPWLLFGYALLPQTTMIQAADLGGVYLLSFVLVLVNASIVEVLLASARRRAATFAPEAPATSASSPATNAATATSAIVLAVGAVAALYAYGAVRLGLAVPTEPTMRIAVVQGSNPIGTQWRPEFDGTGLDRYLRLSADATATVRPSVLIWPESAITFFLVEEPGYHQAITRVLGAGGTDLLLGGPHREGGAADPSRYYNSAFYLSADGVIRGRYDKTHLLPFAEYFPLRTIELLRRRFERVRYFTPGIEGTPLETRAGKIATVICFEGIFPDLVRRQMARGAELLVNLSNDAWLGHGAGPEQHLAMVRLRAVENRTWVVRATTTGISALIDPFGRTVARTPAWTAAVLEGDVVPMRIATFYKRFGDAFAYACLVASMLAFVALRRRRARLSR